MTRKRLSIAAAVTAIACTVPAVLSSGALAATSGTLTGAGSSLITPLMAHWQQDYQSRYNIQVNYGSVGSGTGIADITARTVDFGASDAPLTPAQASACNSCVEIPWALTATGLAYNLPGITGLHLSGPVLANIYLGKIVKWNDARIRKLNKRKRLPNMKITPVFRSDGSGDTYAFTDYLSRISHQWATQVGNATTVSFPTGVGGAKNDGVTAVVTSTPGAIGYVSVSYAIAHSLPVVALQNAAGKYEFPNLPNISAAASQITVVPPNTGLHIVNPPKKYKTAYPLSTFSYVIVPTNSPKHSGLASFIYYAMTTGQVFGAPLDFAPLPAVVSKEGLNEVQALK